MRALIEKTLSFPLAAQLLLAANLGTLLFALIMQFGFGVHPCILCLWQRVPYALAAILSLLTLMVRHKQQNGVAILLSFCALSYVVGFGLAIFHSGVEQHWWHGTAGCEVHPLQGTTLDDLRNSLLQTVTPRCDEIPWAIFGLSMANLNILVSLGLAIFSGVAAVKSRSSRA